MSQISSVGVSFVLPVYNGERWLGQCLEAILSQADGRPMEIIAVDDGSVDRSLEILESYRTAGKVRLLRGPGRGAAAAINLGIRAAGHPTICQVDQDVLLRAEWMRHLLAALEDPGVAATQAIYRTPRDGDLWARVTGLDLELRYRRLRSHDVDHVCTGNSAYRADALHRVDLFDESLGYGYDNDLSYRLTQAGYRLRICPQAESTHRWPEGMRAYLKQQYGLGYGRLDVMAKHRRKLKGDDVSGIGMILHAPAMMISVAGLMAAGLVALAGRQESLFFLAGSIAIVATLAVERSVAGLRASVAFRDLAGLFFAPAHMLRDLAWVTAALAWVGHRLTGRRRGPGRSMFRAPAGSPPPRTPGSRGSVLRGGHGADTGADEPTIVIPVHNEAESLPTVVNELRRCYPRATIVVVDDDSTDSTAERLPDLGVRWLRLRAHLGIGGALRAGLRYAKRLGDGPVVRLDGDGQHREDQIAQLLEPLRAGRCDAVLGSRYLGPGGYRTPGFRRLGQRLLATLISTVTRQKVTDPTSGFWAFGPRAAEILGEHHPTGYPEPELLLFLRRNSLKVVEVPIEMRQRHGGRTSLTLRREMLALARVLLALVVVPLRAPVEEVSRLD